MAFSKLLQLDTNSVTPDRAAAAFTAEVNRLVREHGLSLSAAWAQVKATEPDVFDRLQQTPPPDSSALPNGGTPRPLAKTFLASSKPLVAGAFHLPPDVDDDLLNSAYAANGGQHAKVDPAKVFQGVMIFLMKRDGLTATDARLQMIHDYPELALFAKQMPPAPTPTNAGGFINQN